MWSTGLRDNNNQCLKTPGIKRTNSLGADYILGENTAKAFNDWISERKQIYVLVFTLLF